MADSGATNLPTALVPQEIFPNSFPRELFKFIFSHFNVISLMPLSATSHVLRRQVHDYFVARLSDEAAAYPEVREGLARLGWSKDHKLWTCNCFKLMAGPGFTWRRLKERKRFSAVCSSGRNLTNMSTTVARKTFVITSCMELIYWKIPSYSALGQNSPRSLVSFKNSQFNIRCLSSYDNVLVISLYKHHLLNRSIVISVYNPNTMRKITDLEAKAFGGRISDGEIVDMLVKRIVFAKDTMIVGLHYDRRGEGICTEFQIWKINTKEPQEEGISLSNFISHRNSPLPQFISIPRDVNFCQVNDRFIAILHHTIGEGYKVEVFQRNEEAVLIRQLELGNEHPREIAVEKGQGDLIAVAFECNATCNNVSKLVVQVYSASRGHLVIQKEIGPCPSLRYMQWFGHTLVVVLERDSVLTMISWQEGLNSFLSCPLNVNVMRQMKQCRDSGAGCASNWRVDCLHVDYRGITSAIQKDDYYRNQEVHFQTWDSC